MDHPFGICFNVSKRFAYNIVCLEKDSRQTLMLVRRVLAVFRLSCRLIVKILYTRIYQVQILS